MTRTLPLVLAVALFMENMDSTVIATSLPAIAADIGTSPVALKLALTAYLVSVAIFIPVSGWMADRFGAKRVFRIAILVFIAGSVLCAMSGSLGAFVVSRFLQGMGGAMMTPISRLVLVRATPREQLVSAMAWLTIPALLGPIAGPPLGGFLTTYFSWHWIFLINVPIGLLGIAIIGRVMPEIPGAPRKPMDFVGFFLAGTAASGIVFGLSVVSLPALPPIVGVIVTLLGAVFGVTYFFHQRRVRHPVLDFAVFGNQAFRLAVMSSALFRIGSGAIPFLLPLMFQIGFGLTPFQSGMLTFVTAGGALMMKFLAPTVLRLGGFRTVLIAAAVLAGLITWSYGLFDPRTGYAIILGVLLVSGFLRSLFFTSVNALIFADLDEHQTAPATAIASASQQISIALGVAFGASLLEAHTMVTGEPLGANSFPPAFLAVGTISILAALPLLKLAADAASTVSGHRRRQAAAEPPPAL